jgi:hypothetical protein
VVRTNALSGRQRLNDFENRQQDDDADRNTQEPLHEPALALVIRERCPRLFAFPPAPRGASFGSQRFRMTLAGVSERRECGLMRTRSCYRQRLKAEMQGCASVTLIWLIHSGAEAAQRFCMVMQAIDDHVEVWRFAASGDGGVRSRGFDSTAVDDSNSAAAFRAAPRPASRRYVRISTIAALLLRPWRRVRPP